MGTFMIVAFSNNDDSANQSLTLLRTLRILKGIRVIRILRLFRFCRGLRMMVVSIVKSGMSLFWIFVLLILDVYLCGIYLLSVVTQYLKNEGTGSRDEDALRDMFGSLTSSMLTVFAGVSGGTDWKDVADLLFGIYWFT